ncbi:hypothetical protein JCM8097_007709 [Rhodosporidiobolus ruineniae]
MSATTTGPCVICGEETKTRCSSCASAGTNFMFFCTQEHQKLVWPYHKEVCGKKGNPFLFPGLSKDEVDFAIKHVDTPVTTFGMRPISIKQSLVELLGRVPRDIPSLIRSLSKDGTPQYAQLIQQALLLKIRGVCGQLAVAPFETQGTQEDFLLSTNVWQKTMGTCSVVTQSIRPRGSAIGAVPWMSAFQHRLLLHQVLERLEAIAKRSGDSVKALQYGRFRTYAYLAMYRFLFTDVKPAFPEDAVAVLHEMKLTFIPVDRSLLPPGQPSPEEDPAYYGFES